MRLTVFQHVQHRLLPALANGLKQPKIASHSLDGLYDSTRALSRDAYTVLAIHHAAADPSHHRRYDGQAVDHGLVEDARKSFVVGWEYEDVRLPVEAHKIGLAAHQANHLNIRAKRLVFQSRREVMEERPSADEP